MNTDIIEGKWKQVSGRVQEQWGKLTNDDVQQIDGKAERLEGKLQETYGMTKEQARQAVEDLRAEFNT